jgi:catalase
MFWASMTDVEQVHIVEAFTFELGKCFNPQIRERYLEVLANVNADLCEQVAEGLGLPAPNGKPPKDVVASPALSQIALEPGPIAGRIVGVVATEAADLAGISRLRKALEAEGAVLRIVSDRGGQLGEGRSQQVIERTLLTTRSVEYDAVLIAGGVDQLRDIRLTLLLQELYRHCKAVGAWGTGTALLESAGIDLAAPGVVTGRKADDDLAAILIEALGKHRAWDRAPLVWANAAPPTE